MEALVVLEGVVGNKEALVGMVKDHSGYSRRRTYGLTMTIQQVSSSDVYRDYQTDRVAQNKRTY
jgi:hypothetical protein